MDSPKEEQSLVAWFVEYLTCCIAALFMLALGVVLGCFIAALFFV